MIGTNEKPLNEINELQVNANLFKTFISTTHGKFILGNKGIDFRSDNGLGFIQIPYKSVKEIRVQLILKKHVRGFFIETDDGRVFNFVVSNGKKCLHVFNRKLDNGKIVNYKAKSLFKIFRN